MRVLVISPYFPPQNAVASLRVHSFADALAREGADVTILTVAKRPDQCGLDLPCDGLEVIELEYPLPRLVERLRGRYGGGNGNANGNGSTHGNGIDRHVGTGDKGKSKSKGKGKGNGNGNPGASAVNGHGDARVTRRPRRRALTAVRRLRDRRGIFSSVRMPDITDYWVKPAIRWCRQHCDPPWDVAISSSGPYTAHLVGLAVRREGLARRWVADFRDLWSDNHAYRGVFPLTVREQTLERRCLHAADLVTTVSTGLQRALSERARAAVEVIYNGFDPADAAGLPAASIFADDGLVRLVYTGALYPPDQDPRPLYQALAELRRDRPGVADRLRLTVAGHGGERWRDLAAPFDVADLIEDHGVVERVDALRMQRDASALLLVDWPRASEGVLTGKLFEYVSANAPILVVNGADDTPIADAIRRTRRGHHLGGDVDRIRTALVALVEDPDTLAREPAREFIATLSRARQADRLVEWVKSGVAPGTVDVDNTSRR